jgi:hypothetical protein
MVSEFAAAVLDFIVLACWICAPCLTGYFIYLTLKPRSWQTVLLAVRSLVGAALSLLIGMALFRLRFHLGEGDTVTIISIMAMGITLGVTILVFTSPFEHRFRGFYIKRCR